MAAYLHNLGSPQALHQLYVHCASPAVQQQHHQLQQQQQQQQRQQQQQQQQQHRPHRHSKQRFVSDLSRCLVDFVIQLLPTPQERIVKEDVRKLLERLIRIVEPESRLLSFGSTANGFSLRNSDMDLCCLIDSDKRPTAGDLVTTVGNLLERETKFHVKPLPHARIPIVKLSLEPSPGLPLGISCDIGFENRLALENTRLIMCYGMIDPNRVQTLVLFLKVWSKRRKINSPYKGTLSSYGYVLLVIYFLVHVKNPPILPNLQQMPPLRSISPEETQLAGYNIWFFDDIELLRTRWQSANTETVGELLIEFFRYYSKDFPYNTGVASIRAGLLRKDSKGWQHELTPNKYPDPARERNRLCIEDPFEIDFNVARCVTKDGLYTIRGEFMRATRILAARPDALLAIAQLCEERKEEEFAPAPFAFPPRLLTLPPQTPYTVGSNSLRPKGVTSPDRLSPQPHFYVPTGTFGVVPVVVPDRQPPEHMAPRRRKWTSPPPPEASPTDHTLFETELDLGLELATAASAARERKAYCASCSSNSETLSDEERRSDAAESDDVQSIRSFTEGSSPSISFRRPPWLIVDDPAARTVPAVLVSPMEPPVATRAWNGNRGRLRAPGPPPVPPPVTAAAATAATDALPRSKFSNASVMSSKRPEPLRRSSSGPSRAHNVGNNCNSNNTASSPSTSCSSVTPVAIPMPLPPSAVPENAPAVFYETKGAKSYTLYPNYQGGPLGVSPQAQKAALRATGTASPALAQLSPSLLHGSNDAQPKKADQVSLAPHTPTSTTQSNSSPTTRDAHIPSPPFPYHLHDSFPTATMNAFTTTHGPPRLPTIVTASPLYSSLISPSSPSLLTSSSFSRVSEDLEPALRPSSEAPGGNTGGSLEDSELGNGHDSSLLKEREHASSAAVSPTSPPMSASTSDFLSSSPCGSDPISLNGSHNDGQVDLSLSDGVAAVSLDDPSGQGAAFAAGLESQVTLSDG